MFFKDILVHVDNTPQSDHRLELAIKLAGKHKARLKGIYLVTHARYKPYSEEDRKKVVDAEKLFRLKTAENSIDADWFPVESNPVGAAASEVMNYYAHFHDLVILGQPDTRIKEGADLIRDFPEQVILGSGRPVLVVPYAGRFDTIGERVIVSWRPGRGAARAVHDAIPFLVNAGNVHALAIHQSGEDQIVSNKSIMDVADHLVRSGVRVVPENLITGDISVANILMNYGWENGCDLIVTGAVFIFSRSRVKMGPVAKYLLEHMTLPVLFSH